MSLPDCETNATRRSKEPRHQLIVMNRLSRSNLVQDVTATLELQTVKPPYLMFRDTAAPEMGVLGVWFHDESDRRAIAATLHKLVVRAARSAGSEEAAAASPAPASQPASGRALLDLVKGGMDKKAGSAQSGAPAVALAPSVGALFHHAAHGTAGASATVPSTDTASVRGAAGNAVADLFARATLASAAPRDFATSSTAPSPQGRGPGQQPSPSALSKSQLAQVLLELAGDDSFIDTLHAAYTASIARRAKVHG